MHAVLDKLAVFCALLSAAYAARVVSVDNLEGEQNATAASSECEDVSPRDCEDMATYFGLEETCEKGYSRKAIDDDPEARGVRINMNLCHAPAARVVPGRPLYKYPPLAYAGGVKIGNKRYAGCCPKTCGYCGEITPDVDLEPPVPRPTSSHSGAEKPISHAPGPDPAQERPVYNAPGQGHGQWQGQEQGQVHRPVESVPVRTGEHSVDEQYSGEEYAGENFLNPENDEDEQDTYENDLGPGKDHYADEKDVFEQDAGEKNTYTDELDPFEKDTPEHDTLEHDLADEGNARGPDVEPDVDSSSAMWCREWQDMFGMAEQTCREEHDGRFFDTALLPDGSPKKPKCRYSPSRGHTCSEVHKSKIDGWCCWPANSRFTAASSACNQIKCYYPDGNFCEQDQTCPKQYEVVGHEIKELPGQACRGPYPSMRTERERAQTCKL